MPLRVVFDARRIRDFGIGTYIRNLLAGLGALDTADRFFLIVDPDDIGEVPSLPANFEVVSYSGAASWPVRPFAFPNFLRQFRADMHHIPLNAVPVFMPKPYIVTVHDMSAILFGERQPGYREELRMRWLRRGLLRAEAVERLDSQLLRPGCVTGPMQEVVPGLT